MPDSPNSTNSEWPPPGIVAARRSLAPDHNYQRPDMSCRDHLIMMLMSGAEIEHALMVQYLYAAYSINGDQKSEELRAKVEGWRASILSVAREEMGHFLTVQNTLVLLGAPINIGREMIPWDHQYYPFPFSLEPLSKESLQRFIYAEMPKLAGIGNHRTGKKLEQDLPSMTLDEQRSVIEEITAGLTASGLSKERVMGDMHRVGELYAQIINYISDPEKVPDSDFKEATFDMQASWDDWARGYKPSPRRVDPEGSLDPPGKDPACREPLANRDAHVQVERVATRAQAVKALRALASQGEAPHLREDETEEPSHFERFVQIYEEFKKFEAKDPKFQPTHRVPLNPTTRSDFHEIEPDRTTYIGIDDHNEVAAHYFAQLFNQRYRLLLTYLAHTFRLGRTQPAQQPSLRGMVMHRVFGEMYNLKAIAGLLVRLPRHGCDFAGRPLVAGPPFELPYSLDLPQADRDIWRLYDDLLASSNHTCSEVFRLAKAKDYEAVGEQIGRIGADVYLRTLMNIDSETRRWIDKILAGTA
jgi:hypothetical protein